LDNLEKHLTFARLLYGWHKIPNVV
jgi:hypothetical protein